MVPTTNFDLNFVYIGVSDVGTDNVQVPLGSRPSRCYPSDGWDPSLIEEDELLVESILILRFFVSRDIDDHLCVVFFTVPVSGNPADNLTVVS